MSKPSFHNPTGMIVSSMFSPARPRLSGSRSWCSPPTSLPWLTGPSESIGVADFEVRESFECPKSLSSNLGIWRFGWTKKKWRSDWNKTEVLRLKVDGYIHGDVKQCGWSSNTMCLTHVYRQRGMRTIKYPQLYHLKKFLCRCIVACLRYPS